MEVKFKKVSSLAKAPRSASGRASTGPWVSDPKRMLLPRPCPEPIQLGFPEGPLLIQLRKGMETRKKIPFRLLQNLQAQG